MDKDFLYIETLARGVATKTTQDHFEEDALRTSVEHGQENPAHMLYRFAAMRAAEMALCSAEPELAELRGYIGKLKAALPGLLDALLALPELPEAADIVLALRNDLTRLVNERWQKYWIRFSDLHAFHFCIDAAALTATDHSTVAADFAEAAEEAAKAELGHPFFFWLTKTPSEQKSSEFFKEYHAVAHSQVHPMYAVYLASPNKRQLLVQYLDYVKTSWRQNLAVMEEVARRETVPTGELSISLRRYVEEFYDWSGQDETQAD